MTDSQLIQKYLQLCSEFMGYQYALTQDAALAEEVYQNAAIVIIEKSESDEEIHDFRASPRQRRSDRNGSMG